ncbi:MAG: DUF3631 domain-containing protein [Alphaproteobacteria bacterium]|nr:DUF3631 domain-containing protein [Alphaproteobacteria bacterium]
MPPHPPDTSDPEPEPPTRRSTFRPYTVEEHRRVSRDSLLYAKAARESTAVRYAMLLWPSADVESVVPSGAPLQHLAEPEPHAAAQDGAALLDEFTGVLGKYLALNVHAETTLALWALHTWVANALGASPRLALISPEPQSGKSTALRALSLLVPRPLFAVHGRTAALTRIVDVLRPTLLLDDADKWVLQNWLLRATIAAGAARDTKLLRPTRTPFELPAVNCFSPCALALTWRVPDDLAKRCIAVIMRPAGDHEPRERLDVIPPYAGGDALRAKAVRWANDNAERLAKIALAEPPLSRRARVTWRPLLLLAEAAGGDWPAKARAAAIEISTSSAARSQSVELLDDIRAAFVETQCDRLTSEALIKLLTANAERPWAEKKLTPRALALQLSRYHISPRTLRLSDGFARGYLASDFADASPATSALVRRPRRPCEQGFHHEGHEAHEAARRCGALFGPSRATSQSSEAPGESIY